MTPKATNELEEEMDRVLESEMQNARQAEFEKSGVGVIEYKNGVTTFTPVARGRFYK